MSQNTLFLLSDYTAKLIMVLVILKKVLVNVTHGYGLYLNPISPKSDQCQFSPNNVFIRDTLKRPDYEFSGRNCHLNFGRLKDFVSLYR